MDPHHNIRNVANGSEFPSYPIKQNRATGGIVRLSKIKA